MRLVTLLTLSAVLALALPAHAVNNYWTSVGSAGTPDPAFAPASYSGAAISYGGGGSTASLVARYNITNTTATNTPSWTTFTIGTSGINANTSILVYLFSVDPCTGASTEICHITASSSSCNATCTFASNTFNFSNHAYYAYLLGNRTLTTITPSLFYLSLN
ncbi:MAG: hypothetical protein WAM82_22165 [Thermoanaerobaculia bacterium]